MHLHCLVKTSRRICCRRQVALAVAAGVPASALVRALLEEGPTLFPTGGAPRGRVSAARDALRFLTRPKYETAPLRDLIGRVIDPETRLSDLEVPVLIQATRVRDAEPVLFGPASHPDLTVIDAALSAAAAPMMFPTQRVGGEAYADGAVYAPVPDLLAISEAERLGVLGWVSEQRLVRTVLAAQERLTIRTCRDRLGDRYLRVDAGLTAEETGLTGLDVATERAREVIRGAAERRIRELRPHHPPFW